MAGTCSKCGQPLTTDAKFCGKCGAVVDVAARTLFEFAPPTGLQGAPPAPAEAEPLPTATAMDLGATIADPARADTPDAAAPAAGAPAPQPAPRAMAKTMLGVPPPDFKLPPAAPAPAAPPPAPAAPPPAAAPPPQEQPPAAAGARPPLAKTMLGVAMPGIAPAQPTSPLRSGGTMLGVAIPGIAPLQPGAPKPQPPAAPPPQRMVLPAPPLQPIVPKPAPLVDDEQVPEAPERQRRSGVPMAAVAGTLAGLVLVAGIAVALVWRGAPPLVAQPTLDGQGREALHLTCDGCDDGTSIAIGASKTQFKEHAADLVLASPLAIGDNPFTVQIARPGMGRDETVKIVVPVDFRIRADMSSASAKPPAIVVRVEASPGSEVEVDGKPVALDAQGHGAYSIDITADTEGQSAEARRIDKKIPYSVTHKNGAPAKGMLAAGIGVAPLQLDAPGTHAITDQKRFVVAGQTTPGSQVAVNGDAVPVEPSGAFAKTVDAPTPGSVPVEVVAIAPSAAARAVRFTVKRVDSLDAEAKALEAEHPLSYDGARDIAAHVGQRIVVEGEIIETRLVGHQTILVLTDRRGCEKKADPNQCLARVLFGGEDKRKKGDIVRVFGRITRAVQAQNGRPVPEIEAEFLVKPRRG